MNIVPHIHYSLVNNVSPQGILYPHSYQWMLYPIQYSLSPIGGPHIHMTLEPPLYPHDYILTMINNNRICKRVYIECKRLTEEQNQDNWASQVKQTLADCGSIKWTLEHFLTRKSSCRTQTVEQPNIFIIIMFLKRNS